MNWKPFDIKSFLKASRHWKEDKARLEQELKDISYLPSMENESGVRSGKISELPAQLALRGLKIQAEIEEILLCEEMLKYALSKLTEDEKSLVDGFFYPHQSIGVFVEEYGKSHGLSKNLVYAERNRTLEKLRMLIEAEYYGEEE